MNVYKIAVICHNLNHEFCRALGESSSLPWNEASHALHASTVSGVEFLLSNPECEVEDLHKAWMAERTAAGWVYGEVKNETRKTHPCLVPYSRLPDSQKLKDHLFRNTVLLLETMLLPDDKPAVPKKKKTVTRVTKKKKRR